MLAGGLAAVALSLFGTAACTSLTGGSPTINAGDAPVYRASITASESASVASSSARESERLESLTTAAVHTVCESLSTSSADAVDTVNTYVRTANNGGDLNATRGPAAEALNDSADLVAADINDTVPQQLKEALNSWVESARSAATAIAANAGPDQFNDVINRVNDARSNALNLCDASY